ncbi:probable serine/threonine-protein kinase cdc7 [Aplysia californica]|uniref:Probable serine/threonine-protein kinase cdc7 n=1 Tax=Aplysia californica TaxID=6500 RepID=A0ABM1VR05_APLCA|nr:probable serine/threonine-protein kinase cdc7 [Aplysia californica]
MHEQMSETFSDSGCADVTAGSESRMNAESPYRSVSGGGGGGSGVGGGGSQKVGGFNSDSCNSNNRDSNISNTSEPSGQGSELNLSPNRGHNNNNLCHKNSGCSTSLEFKEDSDDDDDEDDADDDEVGEEKSNFQELQNMEHHHLTPHHFLVKEHQQQQQHQQPQYAMAVHPHPSHLHQRLKVSVDTNPSDPCRYSPVPDPSGQLYGLQSVMNLSRSFLGQPDSPFIRRGDREHAVKSSTDNNNDDNNNSDNNTNSMTNPSDDIQMHCGNMSFEERVGLNTDHIYPNMPLDCSSADQPHQNAFLLHADNQLANHHRPHPHEQHEQQQQQQQQHTRGIPPAHGLVTRNQWKGYTAVLGRLEKV